VDPEPGVGIVVDVRAPGGLTPRRVVTRRGEMTVVYDVDCLHVDGNSAWARGVVTHSTAPDVFFIGETDMLMVHDLGGPGEDIMHIEFVPAEITCSDEVELFPSVIEHGDFSVK
jgi:hypothetical protein